MIHWLRMMLAFAVFLAPGGFLVMLGYVYARALRHRWVLAQATVPVGGRVSLRHVASGLRFKDLVAEARQAATF